MNCRSYLKHLISINNTDCYKNFWSLWRDSLAFFESLKSITGLFSPYFLPEESGWFTLKIDGLWQGIAREE